VPQGKNRDLRNPQQRRSVSMRGLVSKSRRVSKACFTSRNASADAKCGRYGNCLSVTDSRRRYHQLRHNAAFDRTRQHLQRWSDDRGFSMGYEGSAFSRSEETTSTQARLAAVIQHKEKAGCRCARFCRRCVILDEDQDSLMVFFAILRRQLYQYVTAPFSVSEAPSTNAAITVSRVSPFSWV